MMPGKLLSDGTRILVGQSHLKGLLLVVGLDRWRNRIVVVLSDSLWYMYLFSSTDSSTRLVAYTLVSHCNLAATDTEAGTEVRAAHTSTYSYSHYSHFSVPPQLGVAFCYIQTSPREPKFCYIHGDSVIISQIWSFSYHSSSRWVPSIRKPQITSPPPKRMRHLPPRMGRRTRSPSREFSSCPRPSGPKERPSEFKLPRRRIMASPREPRGSYTLSLSNATIYNRYHDDRCSEQGL